MGANSSTEIWEICCSPKTSRRKEGPERLPSLWKVNTSCTGEYLRCHLDFLSARIRLIRVGKNTHPPFIVAVVSEVLCSLQNDSVGSFANSHNLPRFKTFRKRPQDHSSTKSGQGVHHQRKSMVPWFPLSMHILLLVCPAFKISIWSFSISELLCVDCILL
jgi:hypothetical protein